MTLSVNEKSPAGFPAGLFLLLRKKLSRTSFRRKPEPIFFSCLLLLISSNTLAQPNDIVRAHEAIEYAGDYAMVCGVIASAKYLSDSRGGPTHLNFDKPYPDHEFSAVLFKKNRKNFKIKPETLTGYKACVYGKVKTYKGKAQIELVKENQLSVRPPK